MKLIKPSPGLIAEFKAVVAQLPQGEPRKMFGYDAVFVNGNMAVGLWQNTAVMKLFRELDPAGHDSTLHRGERLCLASPEKLGLVGLGELHDGEAKHSRSPR